MKTLYSKTKLLCIVTIVLTSLNTYAQTRTNTWISTTQAGTYTYSPRSVDLDSDGDHDLVISENGFLTKYINNGTGNFTNTGIIPGIRYADKEFEFGDVDNDGDADLVLPYNENAGVVTGKIYLNNGSGVYSVLPGTYMNKVGSYGFTTKIIDINNDGKNDIIYVGTGYQTNPDHTQYIEVWLNTSTPGNVNFTMFSISACTQPARMTADFADIDNDGDLDIATGGASWGSEVFTNNGNVFSSSYDNNDYSGFTYLIDWDSDGDKDLVYYDSYNNSGLKWRRNNGLGVFESNATLLFNQVEAGGSLSSYFHFVIVDVNLDGFLDAAINSPFGTKVLINKGCSFELQPSIIGASGSSSSGLLAADFNNDGFKEIISTYDNYTVINKNDLIQTIAIPFSNINNTVPYLGNAGTISITATATNGGTVRWWENETGGALLSTGNTFTTTITSSTTFYASAINSNGCESGRTAVNATIGSVVSIDTTKPIITSTPSLTLCIEADGSYVVPVASATDNLPGVNLSYTITGATSRTGSGDDASGIFNAGVSTINWLATDATGNTSSSSTLVTVNELPVASISINATNAFCNSIQLTATSSASNSTYAWSTGETTHCISLDASDLDGDYTVYVIDENGCNSAEPAVFSFQKQNILNTYTILAYKRVKLHENNAVQSGSIGIMNANGEAEFKKNVSVYGVGSFVKSPSIKTNGTTTIPNKITGVTSVSLPTILNNTASTKFLPSYTVSSNTTKTLNGNFKEISIKKGAIVTLTGTIFGKISIAEGARVTITSNDVNIESLVLEKGKSNAITKLNFAGNSVVRIKQNVSVGEYCSVNENNYGITFHFSTSSTTNGCGNNHDGDDDDEEDGDDANFSVKGGNTNFNASVLNPQGKINITGSSNSSTYLTGLYIANKVQSEGKNVIWNNYNCASTSNRIIETEFDATNHVELISNLQIYPNPSASVFHLKYETSSDEKIDYKILDLQGRVVLELYNSNPNETYTIGEQLNSGVYIVIATQGQERKTLKLNKTN